MPEFTLTLTDRHLNAYADKYGYQPTTEDNDGKVTANKQSKEDFVCEMILREVEGLATQKDFETAVKTARTSTLAAAKTAEKATMSVRKS